MVDIRWEGRVAARHRARAGTGAGDAEGRRRARTLEERARQAHGCLSRSDGEGTKSRRSFLFRAFVEHPRAGTARSAGHAPHRAAGSLSLLEGKAAPAPPGSATELATWARPPPPACVRAEIRHWRDLKQKPNKQREPLQKGPVQQIKIPVGDTDYTGRGL